MPIVLPPNLQSTTARRLVTRALRLIGVLSQNQNASASDANDALETLNDLLDSWSLERNLILEESPDVFALTPGTAQYTLGATGDLAIERPNKIENAAIRRTGASPQTDAALELIDEYQYSDVMVKTLASDIPTVMWPANDFPNMVLNFWPVPAAQCSVVLYSWKSLTEFVNLDSLVYMPKGFRKALRTNLAVDLAPEYGKAVPPELLVEANNSKANIKSANLKSPLLGMDTALVGRRGFNWQTGE